MSRVTFVVLAVLAVTALAGCSKAPPSGELGNGASGLALGSGDLSTNTYVAQERPAGAIPMVGGGLCPPAGSPSQIPQCVDASSSYDLHVMQLPTPDAEGYKAFLVGAAGEREIGAVEPDAANMWRLNHTFEGEDLHANYTSIEIRMGSFVLAKASAAAGPQPLSLADGLAAVKATGTYKGKAITATVSGLPANGTFVGRLYTCDPESKLLTVAESFPVTNGDNEFTAKLNVGDYAEFHVHVGTSLINLYKAPIGDEPSECAAAAPAASGGAAAAGSTTMA